jgi:hypothetical protein
MSQSISTAANTTSYTTYDTKIPELLQAADIVEAFKLYHYGRDNFSGDATAPATNSIYGNLQRLEQKVVYAATAPASPNVGDLWVDSDDKKMYVRTASEWIVVSATGTSGTTSFDAFFLSGL